MLEISQYILAYGEHEPCIRHIEDGHDRTTLSYQFTRIREDLTDLTVTGRNEVTLGLSRSYLLKHTVHAGNLCLCSHFIFFASTGERHLVLALRRLDRSRSCFVLRLYLVTFLLADNAFLEQTLYAFVTLTIDLFAGQCFLVQLVRTLDLLLLRAVLSFLVDGFRHLTCRYSLRFFRLYFGRIDNDERIPFAHHVAFFVQEAFDTTGHFTGHTVLGGIGLTLDNGFLRRER